MRKSPEKFTAKKIIVNYLLSLLLLILLFNFKFKLIINNIQQNICFIFNTKKKPTLLFQISGAFLVFRRLYKTFTISKLCIFFLVALIQFNFRFSHIQKTANTDLTHVSFKFLWHTYNNWNFNYECKLITMLTLL